MFVLKWRPALPGQPVKERHIPHGDVIPGEPGARDSLAVAWHEGRRCPIAFVWRRQRYTVERVLEAWVIETGWWKDEGPVSFSCWRVRAAGRVFDLRYDHIGKTWSLEQALN